MPIRTGRNRITTAALAAAVLAAGLLPGQVSFSQAQVIIQGQRVQPGGRPPVQGSRQPQNIFEAMFPNLIEDRLRRERAAAPPVVTETVSAPKYFDYKADPMVRVDLKGLVPPVGSVEATPVAATPGAQDGTTVMSPPAAETDAAFARIAPYLGDVSVTAEPGIAKAVAKFYAERKKALWLDTELKPDYGATTVVPVLQGAATWGLDPADYTVAMPVANPDGSYAEADAARFEVEMTARVLRYAMDAAGGRIDPNRISGYHDFPTRGVTPDEALARIDVMLPAPALISFHPDNAPFRALKAELAALANAPESNAIAIPADTLIKPGETHPQVANVVAAIGRKGSPALNEKFNDLLGGPAPTSFTPEVVELVKAFQKEQGLGADGVVGRNTVARLSDVTVEDKRRRVEIAMEQLRWHPHDLGQTYVFINQPAFQADFMRNGRSELNTRVIIGKNSNQTSFFHDIIETVEYNPYWGIPRSILVNEYLPKLRANPAYLDERGYEVTDSRGRRIASANIDWWQVGSNPQFDVRQLPGEANALGELKILFPNKHAIYMHDTPTKPLFERDVRAFSHGCVRLHKPREMAAAVLGTTVSHVEEMLAKGHGADELSVRIPVYVAYFTAWPDETGKVNYYTDVYGRDDRMAKAMKSTDSARHPSS